MYRENAAENRSLLLLGHDGRLRAIHRETGELAWTFSPEEAYGYYVDFVILDGRVYLAAGDTVVCLEYVTGRGIGFTKLPSTIVRLIADDGQLFAVGPEHVHRIDLSGNVAWSVPNSMQTDAKMATLGFPGNVIYGFRDSG